MSNAIQEEIEEEVVQLPRQLSVFAAVDWWQAHIGLYDPTWHIRAYRMYALWINYHHYYRKKRISKIMSSWMDENEGLLEDLVSHIPNHSGTCDSSNKLAYILTYFYFLRELTRAHP